MVRNLMCVVFVLLLVQIVFPQESCTTPRNESGNCIIIHQCPSLINLLRTSGRNLTNEEVELLRKSTCGFENTIPLVCCPRDNTASVQSRPVVTDACTTPSQTSGRCIELNQCPSLFQLFQTGRQLSQETIQYLRQSQCAGQSEGNSVRVCCPLQNNTSQAANRATERPSTTPVFTAPPTPPQPQPPTPPASLNSNRHPNVRLLPRNNCGRSNSRAIVLGGSETYLDEFPWMALILYNSSSGEGFRCGGTLINRRYILTAAHCLKQASSDIHVISVRLGEHDLTTALDCDSNSDDCNPSVQNIRISETIPHPEYNNTSYQNDIGLIRLRNDVHMADNVQPICLPIDDEDNIDLLSRDVTVAGWGQTSNGKSTRLQKFSLRVISNEDCNSVYGRYTQITDRQMCTESTDTLGSCSADGGDPLMLRSRRNEFHQYGVVSFGPTVCGIKSRPEVFTRVVDYLDWILQNMRD